ncbi:putative LysR-family transcriptional regulator [Actinoplanes missouriensis 431]|uniref:Putative LysR-family transcriptional regulator n=1 Tax=Actinoplanes missouriensis (strain ATCC 14538 / DSM 43046 / CBS 188.64 / JCM 3121 / NBRC 102363 / NCIMB 12654 / NRRL B-3342 / UNCC 431) TaxID=512565 RepID=I0HAF0_ACTM4|nr:LysR family transcriptional regulator [Actinoplanes missouriensis]BAL89987.1 putative LysR-family transcriptional regulator [Actinoplanes missouriensis 431]
MTADLRHLRAFLAIAAAEGITRAAAELHVTQPALSRTLRQLEDHLRVRLVDRSTHHLHLTEAGHAFRVRAAAAVAAVDDVLDPARAGTWPLRLGHAWSALGVHTTTLLRRWKQEHPRTPLELLRVDERDAGLTRGVVDAAIVRGPAELPGFRVLPLLTESRLAAVPSDSPLAGRTHLTLAELAAEPIAVNTVAGITGLDLWPPGSTPVGSVEVTNTDDWLATVIAGRAVGLTSTATPVMYTHPAVVYIPVPDAPPVPVRLAWPDPPRHPAVPELVALAREITGAPAP